jgi:hypothetical protein
MERVNGGQTVNPGLDSQRTRLAMICGTINGPAAKFLTPFSIANKLKLPASIWRQMQSVNRKPTKNFAKT